jgi:Flp pilus assembly pilin Flp
MWHQREAAVRRREVRLFWRDRKGATAIEYGLIVALIVIAAMVSFPSMSGWVNEVIGNLATQFPS